MQTPDGELVARTLTGEQAAFAELVDRYRDAVCAVAYHHLGRFDDVQDAAQESFVQAYLRLGQLRDGTKFGPWLRSIAANVCRQALRRGRATVPLGDVEDGPTGPGTDPQKAAMGIVVRDALNRLPEKTRLTVTLSYIDGYSHAEVAEFLEIPVNTVRSRLQHAKKRLREEMMDMVTDVLHEGKPEPEFSVRVVQEALRRAGDAYVAHAAGDALKHFDDALSALEEMKASLPPTSAKRKALEFAENASELMPYKDAALQELKSRKPEEVLELLKASVLWQKGRVCHLQLPWDEAMGLLEQSLEISERLGYRPGRAERFQSIGGWYSNKGGREREQECYRTAIEAYREEGDVLGEANSVLWLGTECLGQREAREGRQYVEQALPLFQRAGSHDWIAVCHATLNLLSEVGEDRFPTLLRASGTCETLRCNHGTTSYAGQPGWGWGMYGDEPRALRVFDVFYQVSRISTFLDSSVPVGRSWSDDGFSYSHQPLKMVLTVKSSSESVTVPAGTFDRCLLTELVTVEGDLPDEAPEQKRKLNTEFLCGTRNAWYAPGVGIVQLHVRTADDTEALIQLREFSIAEPSSDYLPLTIGNSWVYHWASLPEEYVTKEAYRVAANEGELWYLEGYHYAFKR